MEFKEGDKVKIFANPEYAITRNNQIWTFVRHDTDYRVWITKEDLGEWPVCPTDIFPLNSELVKQKLGIK